MNSNYLNYEMFGAVGDGVADDMPAIVACHEEANKKMLPVKTKDGAKYYISPKARTAVIKTDVDFGRSEFIIDDVNTEDINANVFEIKSDYEVYSLDFDAIDLASGTVKLPHEGKALVRIFNAENKKYIRKGRNQNGGTDTSDVFIVDENGKIVTDIDWEYPTITKTSARRIDERKITVKGGIFTTIANQQESFYRYHKRGFGIRRDNVILENVTHYVTGELDHGAPYSGFLGTAECADVTIKNCLLTPHFIYRTESNIPGKDVAMGTYDIDVTATIRTSYIGIKQTIDIMNNKYWGLMGSNFCKEMLLQDCEISRFDAHMGVTNATVRGCKLGHQCLNLIGHGRFILEDTYLLGKHLINLRDDYGSTWHGDVEIKNCIWCPTQPEASVFSANNSGEHDFGYTCYMPKSITIDGLEIRDGRFTIGEEKLYFLPEYDKNFENGKPFPYVPCEKLTVSRVSAESGREVIPFKNSNLYPDIELVI